MALSFLTQYEEDGNDLLEQTITGDESRIHFYELEKNQQAWFEKKKKGRSTKKI